MTNRRLRFRKMKRKKERYKEREGDRAYLRRLNGSYYRTHLIDCDQLKKEFDCKFFWCRLNPDEPILFFIEFFFSILVWMISSKVFFLQSKAINWREKK